MNDVWKLMQISMNGQGEAEHLFMCRNCGQTITTRSNPPKILCPNCERRKKNG